jgi:hypothetical protein
MTIFEYMGIHEHQWSNSAHWSDDSVHCLKCGIFYNDHETVPKDGNFMVSAINKMRENQHEDDFEQYVSKAYLRDDNADKENYIVWLFGSPENFFRLMQEALDKGIIAAQP